MTNVKITVTLGPAVGGGKNSVMTDIGEKKLMLKHQLKNIAKLIEAGAHSASQLLHTVTMLKWERMATG